MSKSLSVSEYVPYIISCVKENKRVTFDQIHDYVLDHVNLSKEDFEKMKSGEPRWKHQVYNSLLGSSQAVLKSSNVNYNFDTKQFFIDESREITGKIVCVKERQALSDCYKVLDDPTSSEEHVNIANAALPNILSAIELGKQKELEKQKNKPTRAKGVGLTNSQVLTVIERYAYSRIDDETLQSLLQTTLQSFERNKAIDIAPKIIAWFITVDLEYKDKIAESLKSEFNIEL